MTGLRIIAASVDRRIRLADQAPHPVTTAAQRPGRIRALLATDNHKPQEGTMPDQPNDLTRKVFRAEIAAVNAHLAETAPSAPADADLRYQVLHALDFAYCNGIGYETPEQLLDAYDAHRPVLPAPVDRVAFLREAADICDEAGAVYTSKALNEHAGAAFALMERFLRKANEAEYVATPCSFAACEPGGEPCTTHERLMAHGEGDHELCEPDCGTSTSRMADEAQQAGAPLRAELKPWQLLGDVPDEPLPQTERLVGGRRLARDGAQQTETPKRPPMDPVHILGIGADEAQQADEGAPRCTCGPDEACGNPCDYEQQAGEGR